MTKCKLFLGCLNKKNQRGSFRISNILNWARNPKQYKLIWRITWLFGNFWLHPKITANKKLWKTNDHFISNCLKKYHQEKFVIPFLKILVWYNWKNYHFGCIWTKFGVYMEPKICQLKNTIFAKWCTCL